MPRKASIRAMWHGHLARVSWAGRPCHTGNGKRFGLLRVLDFLCDNYSRRLWSALAVLAAGLIITVLASHFVKAEVESAAQREFDFTGNETRLEIEARLKASAQMLRSGAALFDATDTVSRADWHTFTRRLQLDQNLPGIQGLGFALLIPRAQIEQHVQAIRGEGFPDYQVRPTGERELYSAIVYLEPFDARNQRAFGYDMYSEPVRRAAMERARDEDAAALSGKVILVQETDEDVQAGVLMYVPVYRHGVPLETIAQRRAALRGWVYSPYRMNDLMRGTLWHWDRGSNGKQISLQVYDGDAPSVDTLLYDSEAAKGRAPDLNARMTQIIPVDIAGHRWTLRFTQPGGMAAVADYGSFWLVLFGGTISTLLLAGLMLWRQDRVRFYRERAEVGEALRQSEERYRVLVEHSADGILIADLETKRFLYANPAMCRMLGYTQDELKTRDASNVVPQDDLPRALAEFEAQARGEKTLAADLPLLRKDGSIVHADINSTVITLAGSPSMLGIFHDITERKRMEATLREQQKLAATGTLARGMAHEINNPLMGIMNYAELITDAAADNAPLVEYATEILVEGRRVAKMTQSLLGFTQQRVSAVCATTTLGALVATVLPPAEETAQAKGLALSCDSAADLPPVTCRPGQLEQVITALLANAMEAWRENGQATEGEKRILISALALATSDQSSVISDQLSVENARITDRASDCRRLRLTVEDNGPGIPATIREQVFDPFFTTKDRTQHAGLGLWISRTIVQEHGGALTFDSEVGRGTRFHLDLPVGDDRNSCTPLERASHE